MMTEGLTIEVLYDVAVAIDKDWHLSAVEVIEDVLIPFTDPRVAVVEHVCHELGHAVLLGIPFQRGLTDDIALALASPAWKEEAGLNEIQTFAVVMMVLRAFGLPVDMLDMLSGVEVQVSDVSQQDFRREWDRFMSTDDCLAATHRIVEEFIGRADLRAL